ncbi:MAG: DNA topoisomerase family protein, partial [Planctomycetota bacterium]|jgi:DNA topoisomerase-1
LKAELVELDGAKFDLRTGPQDHQDLSDRVWQIAEAAGLQNIRVNVTDDPDGKGPAAILRQVEGEIDPTARYRVRSIDTRRTSSRPAPPFITSTLQMAASSVLGFGAQRTMRLAQELYEGVNIPGEGQVGLITYMRTDSTHLSDEAIGQARGYVGTTFGDGYLPEKPVMYTSHEKAQEAHEAIRPTAVMRRPDEVQSALSPDLAKLYRLIWQRFVACQMAPAKWDATSVMLERSDREAPLAFKASGRVLVFDGFYRVTGVPTASEDQTLPELSDRQELAPFAIRPEQLFTSPPPRYSEASLVKALETEGIGRPSTYASIIQVIQDRNYVEQIEKRFHATDLGEVVTTKLVEAFEHLMNPGYTRRMEEDLDLIEANHSDWREMLDEFYRDFSASLEHAHENMQHAKAESQPAVYQCPKCGSETAYRFGKNGRFLSCSAYPKCDYAAPIDREGRPLLPERVNVACPADGSPMVLRTGRFGKFLASVNYPDVDYVVNLDKKGQIKYPAIPPVVTDLPCPTCESPLNLRRGKRGPWLGCSRFPKCRGRFAWSKLEEEKKQTLLEALEAHEKEHPPIVIRTLSGEIIPEGTPIAELVVPGGVQELAIHPSAEAA